MGAGAIKLRSAAVVRGHPGQRNGSARKRQNNAGKAVEPIAVIQQRQQEVDRIRESGTRNLATFMQNNPSYHRRY